jgi:hypothetical protein
MGLRADAKDHTKLAQRCGSRGDDLLIEHFSNSAGALPLVTPAEAVAPYQGPPAEAERALARVIHVANKGLAHSTVGLISDPDDLRLSEVASRGVRALAVKHFYQPLSPPPPPVQITARRIERNPEECAAERRLT